MLETDSLSAYLHIFNIYHLIIYLAISFVIDVYLSDLLPLEEE